MSRPRSSKCARAGADFQEAHERSLLVQLKSYGLIGFWLAVAPFAVFGVPLFLGGYLALGGEEFAQLATTYRENPELLNTAQRVYTTTTSFFLSGLVEIFSFLKFLGPVWEFKREYFREIMYGVFGLSALAAIVGGKIKDKAYQLKRLWPDTAIASSKGIHMAERVVEVIESSDKQLSGKPLLVATYDLDHVMKALIDQHGFELVPISEFRPTEEEATNGLLGRVGASLRAKALSIEEWLNRRGM
ncbi:MAG: hypothetical protein AAF202_02280 [Pseudomonadota bacterium]